MAQLALVQNLVISWHHLHCLQSWPPGCVTCIATLPWIALLALSVSIDLVSSSARVTSVKSAQGLGVTQSHRWDQEYLRPIKNEYLINQYNLSSACQSFSFIQLFHSVFLLPYSLILAKSQCFHVWSVENGMSVIACWNLDGQMLACSPVKNTDNQSLSVDRENMIFAQALPRRRNQNSKSINLVGMFDFPSVEKDLLVGNRRMIFFQEPLRSGASFLDAIPSLAPSTVISIFNIFITPVSSL